MYQRAHSNHVAFNGGPLLPLDNPAYLAWLAESAGNIATPPDMRGMPPPKTVLELDIDKYKKRADAKPLLMAKMAAMNIGRLKSGTWTTAQLVSLMADPEIKSLVSHMETLSFELAIGVVNNLANSLITPAIRSVWVAELTAAL